MSFILDALKKSESDRQRQSGPALFEVKVAPPRSGLPFWALALTALLVVNIGIIAWLLLRHPAAHPAASQGDEPRAAVTPPAVPTPAPAPVAAAAPAAAPATASPAPAPLAAATSGPAPAGAAAPLPGASAAAAPPAPAAGATADAPNPDDYAPATETPPAGPFAPHVRRGTESGVPLYQDQAATPGVNLPQLRLDLHVYAVHPQDRFVMINMHKLREGETVEGARVESITPEGAILSYNGSRFMLPRE
jgi:general secretion pathway protein B